MRGLVGMAEPEQKLVRRQEGQTVTPPDKTATVTPAKTPPSKSSSPIVDIFNSTASALFYPIKLTTESVADLVSEIDGSKKKKREQRLSSAIAIQSQHRAKRARRESAVRRASLKAEAVEAPSLSTSPGQEQPKMTRWAFLPLLLALLVGSQALWWVNPQSFTLSLTGKQEPSRGLRSTLSPTPLHMYL